MFVNYFKLYFVEMVGARGEVTLNVLLIKLGLIVQFVSAGVVYYFLN